MNTVDKKRKSLKYNIVRIHRSRCELALLLSLHCLAIVAVFIAALPLFIQHFLIVALFLSMAFACQRWRKLSRKKLTYQDGHWALLTPMGKKAINACYYWSRFCVVLNLESESLWQKRYCHIFFDACSADDFRYIQLISRYALDKKPTQHPQ